MDGWGGTPPLFREKTAPGSFFNALLGGCRTIRAEAKIRKFEARFWLI